MQFGKIPACKLGGEGVEVRNEGGAAVWREHLSQVRAVANYNKQYNGMLVALYFNVSLKVALSLTTKCYY